MKFVGAWFPDADEHFFQYQRKPYLKALPFAKRRRTAIDVGAHVGLWTRYMARDFSRVVAFEPEKDNFACLLRNTEKLRNVDTYRVALAEKSGWGTMVNPMHNNTGAWELTDGNDISLKALDSFEFTSVDLIKIDTQGSEAGVLEGARETLLREKPIVIVEIFMNVKVTKSGIRGDLNERTVKIMHDLGMVGLAFKGKDVIAGWS